MTATTPGSRSGSTMRSSQSCRTRISQSAKARTSVPGGAARRAYNRSVIFPQEVAGVSSECRSRTVLPGYPARIPRMAP